MVTQECHLFLGFSECFITVVVQPAALAAIRMALNALEIANEVNVQLLKLNQRLRLHHRLFIRERVEGVDEQTLWMPFQYEEAQCRVGFVAFMGDADNHATLFGVGFDLVVGSAEVGPLEDFTLEAGVIMVAGLIASGRHFAIDGPEAGENAIFE